MVGSLIISLRRPPPELIPDPLINQRENSAMDLGSVAGSESLVFHRVEISRTAIGH